MRKSLFVGALLMSFATSASAISFTSSPGAPDPGPAAGQSLVVTFDLPEAAGYSWTGGLVTASGNVSNVYANPAGDNTVFGYVSSAVSPNTATLDTPDLTSLSFYWGSIDRYNKVEILDAMGGVMHIVNGGDFSTADGNQLVPGTNRRVFFETTWANPISGVRFSSTGVAFEFDDIASTVPEPATWAMLIAGFGLVGFAARRRRALAVATA